MGLEHGFSCPGSDATGKPSSKRVVSDHYEFSSATQTKPAWFDVRVLYVRVSPCPSAEAPEQLTMRYPPRSIATALELSGARIAPSEEATLTLRRDRVDTDLAEVTYVSTENVRTSGNVCFEVRYGGDSLLCGTLERKADSTLSNLLGFDGCDSVSTVSKSSNLGWNMDCSCTVGSQSCVFLKGRQELLSSLSPSSMEVGVVGRFSGSPVILTQTVQLTARRRTVRRGTLDVIPEGDESGRSRNRKELLMVDWLEQMSAGKNPHASDDADKTINELERIYSENDGYADGEDGELSWFNAGVRVGVGVGLGMCLGVGLGIGLMVRSYQVTTRSFRRGLL